MSEENTVLPGLEPTVFDLLKEDKDPKEDNTQQVEGKKLSDVEERALASGWKPKDQFSGSPDDFVGAAEFMRRGELFDKIHQQGKELRDMKKFIDQLSTHQTKVEQAGYERAIQELKAAKKLALDDNNTAAVVELDEKIAEARTNLAESKKSAVQEQQKGPAPEYVDFAQKSAWFGKDRAMTLFAQDYSVLLENAGYAPAQVVRMVEQEVRKEFAHKFERQAAAAAAVESPKGGAKADNAHRYAPTAAEKQMASNMVKHGVYKSEADYYNSLRKLNKK
jgi:hypothetical protein